MQPSAQHVCPRCGAPIQVGQAACTNCNLPLDPQSIAAFQAERARAATGVQVGPAPPPVVPPRSRPAWLLPVIGGVVGLCVVCGIIGALTNANRPPATPTVAGVAQASTATLAPPGGPTATVPAAAATNTTAPAAPTDTTAPPTNTVPAPTDTPAAASMGTVGERQEAAGIALTVNKVSTATNINDLLKPKAGNVFLVTDVTVENISQDKVPYNPLYFKVKDADGFEYNASFLGPDPSLKSGDLAKGEKVRGNVAFEVPKAGKGFVLTFEPLVLFSGFEPIQVDLGQ